MDTTDLQALCDLATERLQIPKVKILVKNTYRGSARRRTRRITIPTWVFEQGEEYTIYYLFHEVSHFSPAAMRAQPLEGPHGRTFKEVEKSFLNLWGLHPVYKKAYPKHLTNTLGEVIWTHAKYKKG